jgi:hypothetical protein
MGVLRVGRAWASSLCALAVLTCSGCTSSTDRGRIEPVYDRQTGKLQILKYDSNSNNTIDTVSYMDGSRILRIEIDKDEDGKVERWEHYDADQRLEKVGFSRAGDGKEDAWSYAASDGSILRIEIATHGNGKVSRTEHYEHDTIVRAEEDSDADGIVDKWETYDASGTESRLALIAFDSQHRGRPDRRLVYGGGGVHVEVDPDGDGRFTTPEVGGGPEGPHYD